jgi:hypothetical protein
MWIVTSEEMRGSLVKTTRSERASTPGLSKYAAEMTNVKIRVRAPSYFMGVKIVDSTIGDLDEGAGVTLPGLGIHISEDYWRNAKDRPNATAAERRRNLIRHEYGHILQHRKFGDIYYAHMATRSFASAWLQSEDHETSFTEIEANTLSYFELGFPLDWNMTVYPISEKYLLNLFKEQTSK